MSNKHKKNKKKKGGRIVKPFDLNNRNKYTDEELMLISLKYTPEFIELSFEEKEKYLKNNEDLLLELFPQKIRAFLLRIGVDIGDIIETVNFVDKANQPSRAKIDWARKQIKNGNKELDDDFRRAAEMLDKLMRMSEKDIRLLSRQRNELIALYRQLLLIIPYIFVVNRKHLLECCEKIMRNEEDAEFSRYKAVALYGILIGVAAEQFSIDRFEEDIR